MLLEGLLALGLHLKRMEQWQLLMKRNFKLWMGN
jgi:hypothetical protein